MATFVSMLNWTGFPQPEPADVRGAIRRRDRELKERGLHSVALLPPVEGECAAVIVSTVDDEAAAERLAAAILPGAVVHIDSTKFDE